MPSTEESARTISDYVAIFRRRWMLIALVTAVAVGAAVGYTYVQPTIYRSSMKMVVGQGRGIFPPSVGNVAEQFTQTMSSLIQSDVVAERVVARLGIDESPNTVLDSMHVVTKPQTAVLIVLYDDTDQTRGTRILAAVGDVFTGLVDERLATRAGGPTEAPVSATIFDPAHGLPGRVQPKRMRTVAVALVLGLMLGFVAAFVREQFDDTIRSLEEAERAFGQTATATLPPGLVGYRPAESGRIQKRDPVLAELAVQRLRAGILWSPESRQARTLLVTSAHPEEGKTTVASNLAYVLALEGHNVLVVDADLRRPALHRYLGFHGAPGTYGLDALARGEIDLSRAMIEVPLGSRAAPGGRDHGFGTENGRGEGRSKGKLMAILASPAVGMPVEMGFERTLEIVNQLRKQAEYVIFDAPPILVVTDAYPFAAAVDSVIAVVRNEKSTHAATTAMSRTLDRLQVRRVEMVVTEVEPSFGGSYYDYRTPTTTTSRRQRTRSSSS
jgi:capsular polysaccharide biosynthesis protein/Mrp family chromosome partitioning ATPase